MRPFDFVIAFLASIYALALTHLLLAIAHMTRHRRQVRLDFVHTAWMLNALLLLFANWISLWDFHKLESLTLLAIMSALFYGINQCLVCALVAPRLDGEDGFDMRVFQKEHGRTYIGALRLSFGAAEHPRGLRYERTWWRSICRGARHPRCGVLDLAAHRSFRRSGSLCGRIASRIMQRAAPCGRIRTSSATSAAHRRLPSRPGCAC